MKRNAKRERRPDCDLSKLIDNLERAATAAVKVYRAVEAILRKWKKVK